MSFVRFVNSGYFLEGFEWYLIEFKNYFQLLFYSLYHEVTITQYTDDVNLFHSQQQQFLQMISPFE